MKKLLLAAMALLAFAAAHAQQYLEEIHLKNGSVIRGYVIEREIGKYIKVQTEDGTVSIISNTEIERYGSIPHTRAERAKIPEKQRFTATHSNLRKFGGYIDLGYVQNVRSGGSLLSRIEMTSSYGYNATPNFYAGAGIGLNYFFSVDTILIPILANVRYTIPVGRGNISAFIEGKIGYAVDVINAMDGGFYISPAVGLDLGKLYLSTGYVAQYVYTLYGYNVNMGAISLRIGIKL